MFCPMSAVTSQPLPFGQLEREKHIQMIFRAFQSRRGHPHESQDAAGLKSPEWEARESCPGLWVDNSQASSLGNAIWAGDRTGPQCLSLLEDVGQIQIIARPQLQGPQCVPRRIYSITSGGSREQLFVAVEESSCLCLQCCGPARACSLQGFNSQGQQVFYFERPLRVDACCLGCCLMEMRAYTPQKHLVGSVRQRWSMFTPLLEVCDTEGAAALRIQGPCCPCRCLANHNFQIVSNIGERIGNVWKKWPGFNDEQNMDHEYFGMEVPPAMAANTKLLLLAATFLLNHMFFEMS